MICQIKLFLLIFSLSTIFNSSAFSFDGNKSSSNQLKILNWNVFQLPIPLFCKDRMERTEGIIEVLNKSDYDVIVLQEAFYKKSFNKLAEGLKEKFPYQVLPEIKRGVIITNSGNWIISKHPLKYINSIEYADCKGDDCLARKGAVLCHVEIDGNEFQILGTHLQASNRNGRVEIRANQRKQIAELLQQNRVEGVAQILCGDFNTNKYESEKYKQLTTSLQVNEEHISDIATWPAKSYQTKKTHQSIIDYIFFKPNGAVMNITNYNIMDFIHPKTKLALADHAAIEAIITW